MNATPLGEVATHYLAKIRRRMEANANANAAETPPAGAPAGLRETAPPRPRRNPRKTRMAGPPVTSDQCQGDK